MYVPLQKIKIFPMRQFNDKKISRISKIITMKNVKLYKNPHLIILTKPKTKKQQNKTLYYYYNIKTVIIYFI